MEAFCESLSSPPQYCIDGTTIYPNPPTQGNSHLAVIITVIIISILVLIVLVICIYRKCIKRELTTDMTSRVGELVAHYANKVSKQKIRQREKFIEAHEEEL